MFGSNDGEKRRAIANGDYRSTGQQQVPDTTKWRCVRTPALDQVENAGIAACWKDRLTGGVCGPKWFDVKNELNRERERERARESEREGVRERGRKRCESEREGLRRDKMKGGERRVVGEQG